MELKLKQLSKAFGDKTVLNSVNAEFPSGTITALVGNNGEGKTTLLRLLATLLIPDSGEIQMDGEPLRRYRLEQRRRLIFLEDFPKLPNQSILENIATYVRLWQAERPGTVATAERLLKALDLHNLCHQGTQNLSRGQSYKAALAAMLTVDPELWLLDEPFASGMDPAGLSLFRREAVAAAAQGGRTIIYSTQMVELACGFSDQIMTIVDGKLTTYQTTADFKQNPEQLERLLVKQPAS